MTGCWQMLAEGTQVQIVALPEVPDFEGKVVARVRIELTTPRSSDDPGRACDARPASTQVHTVPSSPLFLMGMLARLLARRGLA